MFGRVNSWRMQNGTINQDDRGRLNDAASKISAGHLWVEDPGTVTASQIAAMCRTYARKCKGLDVLCVDYVQLVAPEPGPKSESRQQQIGKITRKLKRIAKDQNLILLSAAQLNRDSDKASREPRLSDLREAGDIENDTDVVILCHMPGAENNKARAKTTEEGEECKLLVRKNRNGPTGEADMYYFRAFSLWADKAREGADGDAPPQPRFQEFDEYNGENGDKFGSF